MGRGRPWLKGFDHCPLWSWVWAFYIGPKSSQWASNMSTILLGSWAKNFRYKQWRDMCAPGEGECLEFIWQGKYQSVVMAFRITSGLLRDADLHTLATWDCCVRLLFLLGLRQVVVLLHRLRNVLSHIW